MTTLIDQFPYFLTVTLPLFNGETTEQLLEQTNDLYTWGYRAVYQQLMIYEGVPYVVISLERLPEGRREPQQPKASNDAVLPPSPPQYDRNAGLAVPFPTHIERNEVKET